jgi:ribosomal protein S18 acetylase RimI-like enzyme
MTAIRRYDAAKDAGRLRPLFVALHETERAIEPRMRPSEEIADVYLAKMFGRCEEWDGVVLVADGDAGLLGYVCVWRRYVSDEPDDLPGEFAFVSDLVVAEASRGTGLGRALLRAAEASSREVGATTMRLSVLTGNGAAIALYEDEGFAAVEMDLEKRLDPEF